MIVLKSTHEKLLRDYRHIVSEWNALVRLINQKGGDSFLYGNQNQVVTETQFTKDELRSLLNLVHPDKHGGKESANIMTAKVIKLLNKH